MKKALICLVLIALIIGCNDQAQNSEKQVVAQDPHSFSEPAVARTTHLSLNLTVDFDEKRLNGVARWDIHTTPDAHRIVFDTRQLRVERVTLDSTEQPVAFTTKGDGTALLGQALIVPIQPSTTRVNIYYQTSSDADALGWMEPSMTTSGNMPFLFTQGQAILTRTWIPCQDSPGIRFTYDATISVPKTMMALMSAENPQEKIPNGVYHFRMPQAIPPYLIALAVGDIVFRPTGPRTGVYAEPSLIEQAAWGILGYGNDAGNGRKYLRPLQMGSL